MWRAPTAPSHSRCCHPARPVTYHIAHARRRAPSLPYSSWLTALTRRALPCATASFSLLGVSMSRVEFAEKGTAATPNIKFALFLVVFWPFPHPSYPGVRGAGCNLASWSIQTPGFALPQLPAPARSSRSDPDQIQDLAPTNPSHPTYSYLLLPLVGTRGRRGWRCGCAPASATGTAATTVRAGQRWAAVRARGSRWPAGSGAMLGQWWMRTACAGDPERRCALELDVRGAWYV